MLSPSKGCITKKKNWELLNALYPDDSRQNKVEESSIIEFVKTCEKDNYTANSSNRSVASSDVHSLFGSFSPFACFQPHGEKHQAIMKQIEPISVGWQSLDDWDADLYDPHSFLYSEELNLTMNTCSPSDGKQLPFHGMDIPSLGEHDCISDWKFDIDLTINEEPLDAATSANSSTTSDNCISKSSNTLTSVITNTSVDSFEDLTYNHPIFLDSNENKDILQTIYNCSEWGNWLAAPVEQSPEQHPTSHLTWDNWNMIPFPTNLNKQMESEFQFEFKSKGDRSSNSSSTNLSSDICTYPSNSNKIDRRKKVLPLQRAYREVQNMHQMETNLQSWEHGFHRNYYCPKETNRISKSAKEILSQWLMKHRDNPYPTRQEKRSLAKESNLTSLQVCNILAKCVYI